MSGFEIFGHVKGTFTVEKHILELAEEWLPTYVNVVAAAAGFTPGSIAYPKSFANSFDFENMSEELLPSFIVTCPGTVHELERNEEGEIGAWFAFEAGILIADQTEALTRRVASIYGHAIAMMISQRGSLGNLADDTIIQKIETRLPVKENRTLALGQANGETFVSHIIDRYAGPPVGSAPQFIPEIPYSNPAHPYPEWPDANSTDVKVDAEKLDESLTD